MRRPLMLGAIVVVAALVWGGWSLFAYFEQARPIRVGILHSQTGPIAISELSMIDAELLALADIKAHGGLLGRPIEWVIADGKSDWPTFAREAGRLITEEKVCVLFGCWTSASRKNVKPVVEQNDHLLIYPMAYEGLEQSPNIVYTGATANQQVMPAVRWCFDQRHARKFFLVGSDYVWPHAVNAIVKDQLKAIGAELAGEEYIFFGSNDVDDAIAKIRLARPDVVLSSVAGETNLAFYEGLRQAGVQPDQTPVVSFSVAEEELRKIAPRDVLGNYAAWNYFQSIKRPENEEFVRKYKARYGQDRVTSDAMVAAYNGVRLWAQTVAEAGTDDVRTVRKAMHRQSLDAPEGIVSVDPETQHLWRPFYLGKVRSDGQFDIVWSLTDPVRPVPYIFSRTRDQWDAFVQALYTGWGGSWANPVRKGNARTTQ